MILRFALTGLAACLMLASCVSKHKTVAEQIDPGQIPKNAGILVMVPQDGSFGETVYSGSGMTTARATIDALSPHTIAVQLAPKNVSMEEALSFARESDIGYVLQTEILNWEDRATEWSGRPDRITLQMSVYESAQGELIATETAKASSKWATFGGDHPQDLVHIPLEAFFAKLF